MLAAALTALAIAAAPVPTPIGAGPRFHPRPATHGACTVGPAEGRFRAHVELFALRRVVIVPPGIGRRAGCRARVRTLDPTGVVHFDRTDLTLADLFAVWGRRLGPRRLLSFGGTVRVYVGGRRVHGPVRLRDGGQIVVEVGAFVPPHARYLFPPRRG